MVFRFSGAYTAIITPFEAGRAVDWPCLRSLVEFQRSQGITGIVPAGTTGESPTLTWEEHNKVIETVFEAGGSGLETIAGTGSNSTDEALEATRHVAHWASRRPCWSTPTTTVPVPSRSGGSTTNP